MAPFRPFLSDKKQPFYWDATLDEAFNRSKEAIVDAIRHGVEIFDPQRKTCLRTDWSKKGTGYYIYFRNIVIAPQNFQTVVLEAGESP